MVRDELRHLLFLDPAFRGQVAAVILQVLLQCRRDVGSAGDDIPTTCISFLPPPSLISHNFFLRIFNDNLIPLATNSKPS